MINLAWIEEKMANAPAWEKATLFILAPQVVAVVITGFSLGHMWRDRKKKSNQDWFYLRRNVVIWVLAIAWFYTWWLAIFPLFVYTAAEYFI